MMKPKEVLEKDPFELLSEAYKLKKEIWGDTFEFCAIINAKSGICDRGCIFCAQAFPRKTKAPVYPLVDVETMLEGARKAKLMGAKRYSIVTSGKSVSRAELDRICLAVERIRNEIGIEVDVSLGTLPKEFLKELKAAGVKRIHHNLETSKEFYPRVTRRISWEEKYRFAEAVKEEGLELCCGGLFGMGETPEDWISLAESLKSLEPESVPVNFLIPIPGTPLENQIPLHPKECLKVLLLLRFSLPKSEIRLCGGRERNLRELLSIAALFVNGFMVGGYLTRAGRDPKLDEQLVEDLGLKLVR